MMSTNDHFTGPINMGNPNEISMNKLASLIIELSNSKSENNLSKFTKKMIQKKKTRNIS